jgi:hypothetical protein
MILLEIILNEGVATLYAALVAAFFSLLTLLAKKPTEIRAANRRTLEGYIFDLSDSIHQLTAISNILLKNKSPLSRNNWSRRAERAKVVLKALRPKIWYSLWGLENHILSLTRLPDYTLYTLENKETAKKVVRHGSKLGGAIDKCIRNCYLNGRSPKIWELWVIRYFDWRFTKTRNNYKLQRLNRLNK